MLFNKGDKVKVLAGEFGSNLEVGAIGGITDCNLLTDGIVGNPTDYFYGVYVDGESRSWYHNYNELELAERGEEV